MAGYVGAIERATTGTPVTTTSLAVDRAPAVTATPPAGAAPRSATAAVSCAPLPAVVTGRVLNEERGAAAASASPATMHWPLALAATALLFFVGWVRGH